MTNRARARSWRVRVPRRPRARTHDDVRRARGRARARRVRRGPWATHSQYGAEHLPASVTRTVRPHRRKPHAGVCSAMFDEKFRKCLTFDDVMLLPAYSDVLPADADVRTRFTRNI